MSSSAADGGATPILLVDDQVFVAMAVKKLLAETPDLVLHFCADPSRALQMADEIQPYVILQDLVMPEVDGLDLLQQYRMHPSTIRTPVIVLSANESVETKSHAFAAGADDYLVKLPDKVEFIARLRYHARVYLDRRQRDEAFEALSRSEERLLESNHAILMMNAELESANRRISELARTDPLTGLANRRVFDEELEHWTVHAQRKGITLSVILIDIDHFKTVNDTFGHPVGDIVLVAVARLLQQNGRALDLVARYGGEEFIILLPEIALDGARVVAERIRECISTMKIDGFPRQLTASFGVSELEPGQEPARLLGRADTALYRAKANGRNRVEIENQNQTSAA